jgi:hypothetical protein
MTDIQHGVIAFADRREMTVVRELLAAMRDCVDLKGELGLPLVPETRAAIDELEGMIVELKLALLRMHQPDQLELPLDLPAKEGKEGKDASCPTELVDVLGS